MRVALVLLVLVASAAADPAPAEPPPREAYRWVIIGGDVFASVFTFGGSALAYRSRNCDCEDFSGEGVVFGLMAYLAVGAVVHSEAGHEDRAVASVALRVALPIASGVGAHLMGASTDGSLLAAGGGMVVAMGLDWFALAEASRPVAPKTAFFITPSSGGAIAGLGGTLP